MQSSSNVGKRTTPSTTSANDAPPSKRIALLPTPKRITLLPTPPRLSVFDRLGSPRNLVLPPRLRPVFSRLGESTSDNQRSQPTSSPATNLDRPAGELQTLPRNHSIDADAISRSIAARRQLVRQSTSPTKTPRAAAAAIDVRERDRTVEVARERTVAVLSMLTPAASSLTAMSDTPRSALLRKCWNAERLSKATRPDETERQNQARVLLARRRAKEEKALQSRRIDSPASTGESTESSSSGISADAKDSDTS